MRSGASAFWRLTEKHLERYCRLGGMGGAQPLAITMNEGICLAAEVKNGELKNAWTPAT
jgi:urocanate hydratase